MAEAMVVVVGLIHNSVGVEAIVADAVDYCNLARVVVVVTLVAKVVVEMVVAHSLTEAVAVVMEFHSLIVVVEKAVVAEEDHNLAEVVVMAVVAEEDHN